MLLKLDGSSPQLCQEVARLGAKSLPTSRCYASAQALFPSGRPTQTGKVTTHQ